jgi:hypothetical protein
MAHSFTFHYLGNHDFIEKKNVPNIKYTSCYFVQLFCSKYFSLRYIFRVLREWKVRSSFGNAYRFSDRVSIMSDINRNWNWPTNFSQTPQYQISWKFVQRLSSSCVFCFFLRIDGKTDGLGDFNRCSEELGTRLEKKFIGVKNEIKKHTNKEYNKMRVACVILVSCLASSSTWWWRRHVRPKSRLTFDELHDIMSQFTN